VERWPREQVRMLSQGKLSGVQDKTDRNSTTAQKEPAERMHAGTLLRRYREQMPCFQRWQTK